MYDTETKQIPIEKNRIKHEMFLCCWQVVKLSSDGSVEKSSLGYCTEKWQFYLRIRTLLERHREIFLISHNASFDLAVIDILKLIDDMNLKCKVYNPHSQAFYLSFVDKSHILNCIDSLNFFGGKLSKLGDELGFEKLPMPDSTDSIGKWLEYCYRDVEIIVRGLETISEIAGNYGYGELTITRAKLAFSIYQNKFLHYRIELHNRIPQLEAEFAAYFGGRTEAWYNGKLPEEDYYYVDFNSLYPSVMLNNKISTKTRYSFQSVDPQKLLERSITYNVLANVTIQTDYPDYPLRDKHTILFPTGQYRTWLPHAELMDCIQEGRVASVHCGYLYHREKIFEEYVEHFHKLKQKWKDESKPILTYFAKLMLNSLYGKFGQRIPELIDTGKRSQNRYELIEHVDFVTGKRYNEKTINYQIYEETDRKVSTYSSPIIVSEITSLARMQLLQAIRQAGYHNVFYMDTDSLIVNRKGYQNLKPQIQNGKLGFLELEGQSKYVEIFGLKDYKFGDKTKMKGVPKSALEISPAVFSYEYWNSMLDYLRGNTYDTAITETRKKTLKRNIRKGLLMPNNRIVPWRLY